MRYIYIIACLSIALIINPLFAQAFNNISSKNLAKLDKLVGIIKEKHVKEISETELIEAAANGILTSLDSYSYFYNNQNWQELDIYTSGEFSGIGVEIQVDQGRAVIIAPLTGGPAARAGILSGDRIISLNGAPVEQMSRQQIIKTLLGKPDTKLSITIVRAGDVANPMNFSVIRKRVQLPSVESKFFLDGIFYLKIGAFYENTSKSMQAITRKLRMLQKQNKLKGLIIDLQDNPGGLLGQAVNVASIFIEKGNIVSIFSPKLGKNTQFLSKENSFKLNQNIPIIMLINKGTASAAEILTAALRDYKRAIIIGEKSFGKGSVQMFIPLGNGEAMSLTTGLYKTPAGEIIEKNGIIPDIDISKAKNNDLKKIYKLKLLDKKINKKEKGDFFNTKDIISKAIKIVANKNT